MLSSFCPLPPNFPWSLHHDTRMLSGFLGHWGSSLASWPPVRMGPPCFARKQPCAIRPSSMCSLSHIIQCSITVVSFIFFKCAALSPYILYEMAVALPGWYCLLIAYLSVKRSCLELLTRNQDKSWADPSCALTWKKKRWRKGRPCLAQVTLSAYPPQPSCSLFSFFTALIKIGSTVEYK